LLSLIKEEVNVKEIIFDSKLEKEVELDTNITDELKEEGTVRDIIRSVQDMRKTSGLKPEDRIIICFLGSESTNKLLEKNKALIQKELKAEDFCVGKKPEIIFDSEKESLIDSEKIIISIKKK